MIVEKVHNKIRYTLSNEGLEKNDVVYPIGEGRCTDAGGWILHTICYDELTSGFPDEPHTILNTNHSDYKPCQVHTDKGYGPIESYYKIIKKEKRVPKDPDAKFLSYHWIEIK